jgi:phospholipid transport system transporter-binding protein
MPSADRDGRIVEAAVQRDGDTLRLDGELVVERIGALWKPALALLDGVRRLDVGAVDRVDSSGVALLAELAARAGGATVLGDPPGLAPLRAAYRLTPVLGYGD